MKFNVSKTVCSECGSPDMEIHAWVRADNSEYISDFDDELWCPVCEDYTYTKEIEEDWQIKSKHDLFKLSCMGCDCHILYDYDKCNYTAIFTMYRNSKLNTKGERYSWSGVPRGTEKEAFDDLFRRLNYNELA